MHGNILYGTREVPPLALGCYCPRSARRTHKGTAVMHDGGESDSLIVPVKQPNNMEAWTRMGGYGDPYTGTQVETPETAKGEPKVLGLGHDEMAEVVEGRGLAKGNRVGQNRVRTQCRVTLSHELDRVRQVAATLVRHYPRQEPGAVIPHAGICAGGAG
jgi:hypothetical protein